MADPKPAGRPLLTMVLPVVLMVLVGTAAMAYVQYGPPSPPAVSDVDAERKAAEFLAANARKPGVVTTASGLQYRVLRAADGPRPGPNDVVTVDYEGRLPGGQVFDSTKGREPYTTAVTDVVPGWTEMLQLMSPGEQVRVWLPPALGYGAQGAGGVIPPYAVLEFDMELKAIRPAS